MKQQKERNRQYASLSSLAKLLGACYVLSLLVACGGGTFGTGLTNTYSGGSDRGIRMEIHLRGRAVDASGNPLGGLALAAVTSSARTRFVTKRGGTFDVLINMPLGEPVRLESESPRAATTIEISPQGESFVELKVVVDSKGRLSARQVAP